MNETPTGSSPAKSQSSPASYTKREIEILDWVLEGKTNWEIAQILECSHRTIKTHVERIFLKAGVNSRTRLAVVWANSKRISADSGHGSKMSTPPS